MPNPYYFTDRALQVGFIIKLDSHHINDANSIITINPAYPEFGIENRYNNKITKETANIYARLKNQNKFNYQTVFSARFDKQNEDDQILDETELYINLNINQNLTQSDFDKIDVKSPLGNQIQQQEMKNLGWRFDKINSMTIYFYQTGIVNGSNYVKLPLRGSATLNIENDDKYCFLRSFPAHLHPCNNNNPNRVSSYRQYFNELIIEGIDFSDGFRCSDIH